MKKHYFVHKTAVIDKGAKIGRHSKIWHFSHVCAGARIGANCVLGQNVYIGPGVHIGDYCKIQNNVSIYEGVTLEDFVFVGPSAVFTNVRLPRAAIDARKAGNFSKTMVKNNVTIGANATIICGVFLGVGCFVAAGAVVTRNVGSREMVIGVPARSCGLIDSEGRRIRIEK